MAKHAFGTTFTWDTVVVAELTNINGIELSAAMIDVSTHQSSDTYTETIPGMLTAGDVAIEGLFDYTDTTGQHAMITDFNARSLKTGIITFPAATGATWTLSGYITNIKIGDAGIDGAIPFTATIKPTGKPTFAVATSAGLTTPFFSMSESAVIVPAAANDNGVYPFIATVLTGVTSLTVTPTAAAGVITVDGNTVGTGVASSAITLDSAGTTTRITVVVTETSKAPKTIYIDVARAAS